MRSNVTKSTGRVREFLAAPFGAHFLRLYATMKKSHSVEENDYLLKIIIDQNVFFCYN